MDSYRVEVDSSNEKIGYKIREAQLQKIPYMIILGKNEALNSNLSIRTRSGEKIDGISLDDFIKRINSSLRPCYLS